MDITGLNVDMIPTLAMGMAQANTLSAVNMGILDMSLDSVDTQAASLTKMMEQSVNPAVGGNFDMSV